MTIGNFYPLDCAPQNLSYTNEQCRKLLKGAVRHVFLLYPSYRKTLQDALIAAGTDAAALALVWATALANSGIVVIKKVNGSVSEPAEVEGPAQGDVPSTIDGYNWTAMFKVFEVINKETFLKAIDKRTDLIPLFVVGNGIALTTWKEASFSVKMSVPEAVSSTITANIGMKWESDYGSLEAITGFDALLVDTSTTLIADIDINDVTAPVSIARGATGNAVTPIVRKNCTSPLTVSMPNKPAWLTLGTPSEAAGNLTVPITIAAGSGAGAAPLGNYTAILVAQACGVSESFDVALTITV